ncbi:MAG: aldolase/citrate lyase family protein [Hyphomicrobiaceae bacterium]
MRANRIKEIWAKGETVLNGWCAIPSSISAELMAHQAFDSVCIDLQHGAIDYQTSLSMLQAISTTDRVPLARIPWNDPAIVGKMLDAGAYGLICPMVNTREECERFVGACRYAPDGYRSVGPLRASLYAGADYWKHANKTVLTFAMIETKQAVAKLDEIMSVPGLDAIYVGPSDLSVSMGENAGFDPKFPEVLKAIETIAKTAKKHGVVAGIHTGSVAYALQMVEMGYRFVTYLSDFRILQIATDKGVKAFRAGKPETNVP